MTPAPAVRLALLLMFAAASAEAEGLLPREGIAGAGCTGTVSAGAGPGRRRGAGARDLPRRQPRAGERAAEYAGRRPAPALDGAATTTGAVAGSGGGAAPPTPSGAAAQQSALADLPAGLARSSGACVAPAAGAATAAMAPTGWLGRLNDRLLPAHTVPEPACGAKRWTAAACWPSAHRAAGAAARTRRALPRRQALRSGTGPATRRPALPAHRRAGLPARAAPGYGRLRGWREVIVYPTPSACGANTTTRPPAWSPRARTDSPAKPGSTDRWCCPGPTSGRTWMRRAGLNVVVHEIAHKLDMQGGGSDGVPPLPAHVARRATGSSPSSVPTTPTAAPWSAAAASSIPTRRKRPTSTSPW